MKIFPWVGDVTDTSSDKGGDDTVPAAVIGKDKVSLMRVNMASCLRQ